MQFAISFAIQQVFYIPSLWTTKVSVRFPYNGQLYISQPVFPFIFSQAQLHSNIGEEASRKNAASLVEELSSGRILFDQLLEEDCDPCRGYAKLVAPQSAHDGRTQDHVANRAAPLGQCGLSFS